jgi:hypothetical protein
MHLLSGSQLARLKANKRGYDYLLKHEQTFKSFARGQVIFARSLSPPLTNEASIAALVGAVILQVDKSIWGLKTDWMPAEELADLYGRWVVGHEN